MLTNDMIPDRNNLRNSVISQKRLFPDRDLLPWSKKFGFNNIQELESYIAFFNGSEFMKLEQGSDNEAIPAGYTYLGQFIAHELTFDPRTVTDGNHQMNANLNTPILDLESVYGGGPLMDQEFYDHSKYAGRTHFYIKKYNRNGVENTDMPRTTRVAGNHNIHLPLIGDKRNDDNLIISQLHIAIQHFHNKIADELIAEEIPKLPTYLREVINRLVPKEKQENNPKIFASLVEQGIGIFYGPVHNLIPDPFNQKDIFSQTNLSPCTEHFDQDNIQSQIDQLSQLGLEHTISIHIQEEVLKILDNIFDRTQQQVQWYFQWVVLYDFLPKVAGTETVEEILGAKIAQWGKIQKPTNRKLFLLEKYSDPYIPKEFSAAVYRFGHSMVVRRYAFQSDSGGTTPIFRAKPRFQPVSNLKLDWDMFFFYQEGVDGNESNFINPFIAPPMSEDLPEQYAHKSIVFRNLVRSMHCPPLGYGFPSGQDIALKAGIKVAVKSKKFKSKYPGLYRILGKSFPKKIDNNKTQEENFEAFCDDSPLWFYILMEALVEADGKRLGPLGARIVAEVIIGVLEWDNNSMISQTEDPDWGPIHFKGPDLRNNKMQGDNSMIKFLRFAGVYPLPPEST